MSSTIRATGLSVNQGETTITCTGGQNFSQVAPSSTIMIDGVAASLILVSGTAPDNGTSTLTLASAYPNTLPNVSNGTGTIEIGYDALASVAERIKDSTEYINQFAAIFNDFVTVDNASYSVPLLSGATASIQTIPHMQSRVDAFFNNPEFTEDTHFKAGVTVNPASGGNGIFDVERTAGATVRLVAQSAAGQIGTVGPVPVQIMTNSTAWVTVDNSGNTSVSKLLGVGTDASSGVTIRARGTNTSSGTYSLYCENATPAPTFYVANDGSSRHYGNVGINGAPLSNVDLYIVGSAVDDAVRIFQNTASTITHIAFINSNGTVGSVTTNGTSTSFNTASDPRFKIFKPLPTDAEINTEFDKLYSSFRIFDWKNGSGENVWGFDAHVAIDSGCDIGTEGQGPRNLNIGDVYKTEEIPEVTEDREMLDEDGNGTGEFETVVTQEAQTIEHKVTPAGVDQSKAVPILLAKIEQLERRLAALEA